MSTISLLTSLVLYLSHPTYTEFFQDKDIFFYSQKGNFYTVTNLTDGKKTIGLKTKWGNCYLRIYKINPEKLRLAEGGWEEVKKQVSQSKFDENNYKYYERILDNLPYSDSFAYTFLCWRTSYQLSKYGVSNYSVIPNNLYNRKRRMVINKLKRHLKICPYSTMARQQIAYLETLSDITRGGFMGNSVLGDLVFLSGDE